MYSLRLIIRSRCIRSTGHSRYIRGLPRIPLHRVKGVEVTNIITGKVETKII